MSARSDLLEQLMEEIAVGWPRPYHDQDATAAQGWDAPEVLVEHYLDLLGDAHTLARKPYVEPSTKHHLRSVS